tara:strand:- start:4036 stop:4689 length:654 start_codon:yes stop_codon:yes gene_type:complete
MNKIMICCPGSNFSLQFVKNITDLLKHFKKRDIQYKFCTTFSRNIYETRNNCLLGDPENNDKQLPFNGEDYSHILWIDDDIVFKNSDFDLLFDSDKDIISGFYIMADGKQYAAVKIWDEEFFSKNGYFQFMAPDDIKDGKSPTRVEYVGFGFLLIKKGIFEQFEYPWFEPTYLQIRGAEDFSMEDVTFCLKCKKKNIAVFAHPKVIVGHNKIMELKL